MKKINLDSYDTRVSLFDYDVETALDILRLGMTKSTFQMLTGNFKDFNPKSKLNGATFAENSIATKNFEVKALCTPEKKDVIYYDSTVISRNINDMVAMADTLDKNAVFYAIVAHILQILRLKYPFVELDGNYTQFNSFKASLMLPITKKGTNEYRKITLEFLNGDSPAVEKDGIKILCYRYSQLTQSLVVKLNSLLKRKDNVVFAFYDENNFKLPLFCTQKGDYKGSSFMFSSSFTHMLRTVAKEASIVTDKKIFEFAGNAIDDKQRLFSVTQQDEMDNAFIKVTDETLPSFLKKSIYYNIPFNLTTEECVEIEHALKHPAVSNLMIADRIAFEKSNAQGLYDYLIQRTNEVVTDDVIASRIELEKQNQENAFDYDLDGENLDEDLSENQKENNEKDFVKDEEENLTENQTEDKKENQDKDFSESKEENLNENQVEDDKGDLSEAQSESFKEDEKENDSSDAVSDGEHELGAFSSEKTDKVNDEQKNHQSSNNQDDKKDKYGMEFL